MRKNWIGRRRATVIAPLATVAAIGLGAVIMRRAREEPGAGRQAALEIRTTSIVREASAHLETKQPRSTTVEAPLLNYSSSGAEGSDDPGRHWDVGGTAQFADPAGEQAAALAGDLGEHLIAQGWAGDVVAGTNRSTYTREDELGTWSVTIYHRNSKNGHGIVEYFVVSPQVGGGVEPEPG